MGKKKTDTVSPSPIAKPKKTAAPKKEAKPKAVPPPEPIQKPAKVHRANLVKLIHDASRRSDYRRVFGDFVEMAAIAISNAVNVRTAEPREKRYMEIAKAYTPEEMAIFPKMFAELTLALEAEPHDALGMVYGELEVMNKHMGQFFTPYELCRMMARMMVDDQMRAKIAENGYITVQEPACGAGANIIALAQEMHESGINYQKTMHVVAVDLDIRCVHMCYLQFSLLNIPAVIWHGNTLSLQMYSSWKTPAHILDGWFWRLKSEGLTTPAEVTEKPESVVEMPGPIEEVDLSKGLPGTKKVA